MDYGNGSAAGSGALFGLLFAFVFVGIELLLIVGIYVLNAIALSQFFRKVGVERWIAWVPIYNSWKWLEVGGQPGWIAVLSVVPYANFVTAVFLYIGMYRTGFAFRKDGSWVVLGIFLPFVWCFLLARETEIYDPSLIAAAGYPPPRAGYGSVPPGAAPQGPPPGWGPPPPSAPPAA